MLKLTNVKHILLDIDGTLLPLTFTRDTLFPYALTSLPDILSTQWSTPTFQSYLAPFPPSTRTSPTTLLTHYTHLSNLSSKDPAFKALQGHLFATGYTSGALSTGFFADVAPALRRWREAGIEISVYSAGSVEAQRLLFQYADVDHDADTHVTEDLRGLVSRWFDTTTAGLKTKRDSYDKILAEIGVKPQQVVFFSDMLGELEAARESGIRGMLVERQCNPPISQAKEVRAGFEGIGNFEEVVVERVRKRGGKMKGSAGMKRKVDESGERETSAAPNGVVKAYLKKRDLGEKQTEPNVSQKRRRSQRLSHRRRFSGCEA